ncbi:MAG: tyrosine-type recombinase/integrase [Candidatus Pseudobacter hemicellulosilyticus]|uniref:Tyrosine-type recombinase/integrase n=1 Tax=Candidatus Pseudobacter hemicellulosilyticus TaxID=3121375 RepID=A0AAJ5WSX6_9BACT|nr:MAG: tyrosine-type recombinase/integrase [Pseudobacter sp.]
MSLPIQTAINGFLDYIGLEKRYSPHTISSYGTDLAAFSSFLLERTPNAAGKAIGLGLDSLDVALVSSTHVRAWLASLKNDEQLGARSINRKISTLKSFFKYHLRIGNIQKSPMKVILAPKNPRRLPMYVEEADMRELLTKQEFPDTWQGFTDKLLVSVLYFTGMRRAELQGLKEGQVDKRQSTLRVLGKGNKERILPVPVQLVQALQHYMAEKRRLLAEPDTIHVFVTEKGAPLYPNYIYKAVNHYLKQVTTIEKKSPHILRHSFATHLTANGAEINAVKELLGHSSLAATQIYTHINIEKLKEAYKKAHPKAE